MCDPATLAITAAVVSSAGSLYGGAVANAQAKYQASVAEANAVNERENIRLEGERSNREMLLHYRKVAQLKGQQRVAAAANGVSTDFGTAQDIVTDTNMLAREDAQNYLGQSFQNVRGMDRNVSNFVGEARAQRAAGKGAMIGAAFDAAGTMLGGVSQYGKLKADGYGGGPSKVSSAGRSVGRGVSRVGSMRGGR
jgi:hypothetical protein